MKYKMLVEDENHRVELEQICRMQMAKCFLSVEFGYSELFALVALSCFGLAERNKSVRLDSLREKTIVISAH